MFTAGPDLKIGDGDDEEKVGYVFMENECDTNQNDKPRGCSNTQNSQNPCRTVNCLVEPAYVASYAPYGRAAVTGSWQYTSNTAAPTTWATTTRVFELDISQFQLDEAGSSGGGNPPGAPGSPGGGGNGGGGGGSNPPDGGGGGGGSNPPGGGGGGGGGGGNNPPPCTQKPAGNVGCTQTGSEWKCPGTCGEPNVNDPCC